MKKILLILSILLLCSCENDILGVNFEYLDIWLDEEIDNNGYYHIEYDGNNYDTVYFLSDGYERVYWNSPNGFFVYWNNQVFEQPIVNYSTYADEWGNGQQLFYLDNTQIGDTLMIFGYVSSETWDYLYFILEDNE